MNKQLSVLALLLLALQACAPSTPVPTLAPTEPPVTPTEAPVLDTAARLEQLGGAPCPDSDFTCITLTVPLDHFHPDGRTIDVVFGVLPASGERKGIFVTATGGPGTAGLQSADSYTAAFDPSIPEHFDIVFFDQRGVGQSGGLQCADAAAAFYRADWSASTPDEEAALVDTARTFAEDCVAEMGNPDILPYLGTAQAVEDLEFFRRTMGDEKIWLYGESYGTQYAQTYAAAHPDRLAALILDGTVDLTLSGTEFYAQQAQAFNDVLVMTLEACNDDPACVEDMGGDALAVYDELAARLKESPLPFDFPLPSGGVISRTFSLSDLETAASGFLYSENARMIFLRALAAYARDEDLIPLARVFYSSLLLDPESLEAIPDPSYSDAVYYAVECQDYGYFSGTPEERAEAYLRAGDATDASLPRFASIFYGDMPCPFWPNATDDTSRPAPLTLEGVPALVLGGTADPATPNSNGVDVFSRLDDGYLVTETGGPHIIFGWGVSCVDELVTAFLVDDAMPERETTCEGVVAAEFAPLAPRDAADFESPLEALASVDDELYYMPEYYYWDVETPTSIGCPFGGTFVFEPSDSGEIYRLTNCAFSEGFVMTGDGSYNYDEELFTLNVVVGGLADGLLVYTRDADYNLTVTGQYDGEAVDLSN
ncbi:MAG: alpha/beta fold hydrolase [Chloroflexota bacterium]